MPISHSATPAAVAARAKAWARVVAAEPRLWHVYADIQIAVAATRGTRTACANRLWFLPPTDFKGRVADLVGWARGVGTGDPWLKTSDAYDAAYAYLYDQLPNCRNCGCL